MKMVKCDVCGSVVHNDDASALAMTFGSDGILYNRGNGDCGTLHEIKKDLCRTCAIKIAKILYPKIHFLGEEEYKVIMDRG